jgi:hypothetical protein
MMVGTARRAFLVDAVAAPLVELVVAVVAPVLDGVFVSVNQDRNRHLSKC